MLSPAIPCDRSDFFDQQNKYEEARRAFQFLNHAHNSTFGDIYAIYIVLALGLAQRRDIHADNDASDAGGLNLLAIAEMTGVPRETIRRKLSAMIVNGIVMKRNDRTYALADPVLIGKVVRPLKFERPLA